METIAKYKANIEVVSDKQALAQRGAAVFLADAKKAINAKDVFHVAISGGQTPKQFFELLGEMPETKELAWQKIHLFWVDERCVPADSEWSNYKLAEDTFLGKVTIPQENVHRIPTEYNDFRMAAQDYEKSIRAVFHLQPCELPRFDLIVLGMGAEGHTGSLFPDSYATFDTEDLACVVYVMDKKLDRITLTYPVLRAAEHLAVLVSGQEKADILKQILTSEPDEAKYPIHVLWPVLDKVTWLVDREAARLVQP